MKRISIFVLLGLLTACLQAPDASPAPDFEEPTSAPAMPVASADIFTPPITAPSPQPTVAEVIEAQTSPANLGRLPMVPSELTFEEIAPIFYEHFHQFILLGAAYGGNWLHPIEVYPILGNAQTYDFYDPTLNRFSAVALVPEPDIGGPGQCDYLDVQFVEQAIAGEPPILGVKPGQSVDLRTVDIISRDYALYEQYLQEWLALHGITSNFGTITNILRTDIENDGVDEIFLVASYFKESTGHMVEMGDYSVVLMRKVVNAQVYTMPVVAELYYNNVPWLGFPATYEIDNIYDLNGDGKLEIILFSHWWEGEGLFVYDIHGLNVSRVLKVSCGLIYK